MGMFSWQCCKCNEPINAGTECVLVVPDDFGQNIYEPIYNGYGDFGPVDVYEEVAKWNEPERAAEYSKKNELRGLGIDIACYDDDNGKLKFPIKVACGRCFNGGEKAKDLFVYAHYKHSLVDPNQGFNFGSLETTAEREERESEEAEWACQ